MASIAETVTETIQLVFPEHAGAPGQIHGGRMMEWITEAGTMAAARVARGQVVLGAMDDIDFLHPVKVGEIAILRAQVEDVGRSSLEVGVRVWAENVSTGARSVTLNSHLVFVNVGDDIRPRPVQARIEPSGDGIEEPALLEQLRHRGRLAARQDQAVDGRQRVGRSDLDRVGAQISECLAVLRDVALQRKDADLHLEDSRIAWRTPTSLAPRASRRARRSPGPSWPRPGRG